MNLGTWSSLCALHGVPFFFTLLCSGSFFLNITEVDMRINYKTGYGISYMRNHRICRYRVVVRRLDTRARMRLSCDRGAHICEPIGILHQI